jgi:hypothetical protein
MPAATAKPFNPKRFTAKSFAISDSDSDSDAESPQRKAQQQKQPATRNVETVVPVTLPAPEEPSTKVASPILAQPAAPTVASDPLDNSIDAVTDTTTTSVHFSPSPCLGATESRIEETLAARVGQMLSSSSVLDAMAPSEHPAQQPPTPTPHVSKGVSPDEERDEQAGAAAAPESPERADEDRRAVDGQPARREEWRHRHTRSLHDAPRAGFRAADAKRDC